MNAKDTIKEDGDALDHLTAYNRKLLRIIYDIVGDYESSKDVLQNTYLKAIRAIQNGQYSEENYLQAWLSQIARNESINYLRSKSQRTKGCTVSLDHPSVHESCGVSTPHNRLDYEQIQQVIRSIVSQKGEIVQRVFDMFFLDGETMETIATELGKPHNTIKSIIYRMRHQIIPMGLKDVGYSDDDLDLY